MASKRRDGRGWLHTIDKLPPEADEAVQWAAAELMDTKLSQQVIREEFNRRLDELGLKPVSSGSFNRYALRQAASSRALAETRKVAEAVVAKLGPDKADNVTVLVVELIKTAAYDLLAGGQMSAKELQSLARALAAAQNAERVSNDNRKTKQADEAARTRALLDVASEAAAEQIAANDPVKDKAAILKTIREAYLGEAE